MAAILASFLLVIYLGSSQTESEAREQELNRQRNCEVYFSADVERCKELLK